MDQLSIDNMEIEIRKIRKTFFCRKYLCWEKGFKTIKFYRLPDISYGESFFTKEGLPEFYVSSISEEGEKSCLLKLAESHRCSLNSLIVGALKREGIDVSEQDAKKILLIGKESVEELELLELKC